MMKWVVIANSSDCKIYECDKKTKQCEFLHEVEHPESRLKAQEINSDKPGHYKSRSTNRGAYGEQSWIHQAVVDDFAREIASLLDKARKNHEFDELLLVTPSKMYGSLYGHMTKQVASLLTQTIQKNMLNLNENELYEYVRKHLYH